MPVRPPQEREAYIEKKVCEYAKKLGMHVCKFTSPGKPSVPDRIFFVERAKGSETFLIEFKSKGCKPTVKQQAEIDILRSINVPVYVVDNVEEGKTIVDMYA